MKGGSSQGAREWGAVTHEAGFAVAHPGRRRKGVQRFLEAEAQVVIVSKIRPREFLIGHVFGAN